MSCSTRFTRIAVPSFLLAAAVAGCGTESAQPPVNEAETATTNLPAMPIPEPALDRSALLGAIAQAVSAWAAGADLPEDVRSLDGRQFEVRIRFGCRGQSKDLEQAWLGWSYDQEQRTLRVRAKPTVSKDEPLVAKIAGDAFESVEGFWIPRPWLLQPTCPATAALSERQDDGQDEQAVDGQTQAVEPVEPKGEPVPVSPRIGIAQFFTSDDARTHRRGSRPYSTVKTMPEGTALPSQGFNLVLSGRLRALPGRSVIECTAEGADAPPECLVSAEFLRVWIERPESKDVIAEWGSG